MQQPNHGAAARDHHQQQAASSQQYHQQQMAMNHQQQMLESMQPVQPMPEEMIGAIKIKDGLFIGDSFAAQVSHHRGVTANTLISKEIF